MEIKFTNTENILMDKYELKEKYINNFYNPPGSQYKRSGETNDIKIIYYKIEYKNKIYQYGKDYFAKDYYL